MYIYSVGRMEDTSDILLPRDSNSGDFQPKKIPQYVAALAGNNHYWCFRSGECFRMDVASFTRHMQRQGHFHGFDTKSDDATWISALTPMGALVAGFAAGYSVDKIGRKNTMLALTPPFVAGWLIMAYANSLALVMVGRFITGFCGGSFSLIIPIYASEIGQTEVRGMLSNMLVLILGVGILFTYSVGAIVSWQWLCIISAVVPIMLAMAMIFMPESPRFLLAKGRDAEARDALKWLRGASYDGQVEAEMQLIADSLEENRAQSATFRDLLAGPVLKPTGISLMLMFLQQFGGINAVIFYSVDIFQDSGSDLDPNVSAIIIAAVQVVSLLVSTILVERLGRKILLIVSDFGMGASLLLLGVYFYLKDNDAEKSEAVKMSWLPLLSLVLYIITYNLAMGPLPWTMMGELLPPHVKSLTAAIATAFNYSLAFTITKFFPSMLTAMHPYGCYWLFSAISFLGFLFSIFLVPETKGRSLDEIQRDFGRR